MFEVRLIVREVRGKIIVAKGEGAEKILVPIKAFRGLHRTMWGEVVIGNRNPVSEPVKDSNIFRVPEKGEVLIAYISWVNDLCFSYGWNFAEIYDEEIRVDELPYIEDVLSA